MARLTTAGNAAPPRLADRARAQTCAVPQRRNPAAQHPASPCKPAWPRPATPPQSAGMSDTPHTASQPTGSHDADDATDLAALVLALIHSRQSVVPKRLLVPGPDETQLRQLIDTAACAPDHRGLKPWRLVRIADHQRTRLADLFEACARDRDPPPDDSDLAKSRAKAHRAPTLLLAVLKASPPDPEVPLLERAVTLGAALMAMLLAAHGMGLAAMLTSGRAVRTARFAQAFGLADDEQAVCFVSIGTAAGAGRSRPRAPADDWLSDWAEADKPACQPGPPSGTTTPVATPGHPGT